MAAESDYAWPMLLMIVLANAVQALLSHLWQQEGPFTVFAALCGLKPFVDGFKIVFGIREETTKYEPVGLDPSR